MQRFYVPNQIEGLQANKAALQDNGLRLEGQAVGLPELLVAQALTQGELSHRGAS
jgi:hypothetical protein